LKSAGPTGTFPLSFERRTTRTVEADMDYEKPAVESREEVEGALDFDWPPRGGGGNGGMS